MSANGNITCLVLSKAAHATSASIVLRYVMSAAKTVAFVVLCIRWKGPSACEMLIGFAKTHDVI